MTERNQTPEDVRRSYDESLPNPLGALFFFLWGEIALLHSVWATFRALFESGRERLDLLDHCASSFFADLHWVLHDDLVIRIGRLLDPPSTAGRANASIPRLIADLTPLATPALASRLSEALGATLKAASGLREIRNTRVGHSAFQAALAPHHHPPADADEIETVLDGLRAIMNGIEAEYRDAETDYVNPISKGDADELVFWLELARKHETCR